jgi:hypothetical protein
MSQTNIFGGSGAMKAALAILEAYLHPEVSDISPGY